MNSPKSPKLNYGNIMILQTLFPDENEEDIELALQQSNGNVHKAKRMLEEKGSTISESGTDATNLINLEIERVILRTEK
jgi:hypothetical protein